jgi:hypothetical protein
MIHAKYYSFTFLHAREYNILKIPRGSLSRRRVVKMAKKLLILGVALIISLGLLAGCGDAELKQGVYVTEDGLASVTLSADNEFIFVRHIATSYVPTGNYSIQKGKLILHVSDNEEYVFNIKSGQIVFVSGFEAETLITKGVFKLSE